MPLTNFDLYNTLVLSTILRNNAMLLKLAIETHICCLIDVLSFILVQFLIRKRQLRKKLTTFKDPIITDRNERKQSSKHTAKKM